MTIFGLLALMSFIMLSLLFERLWFYRQIKLHEFKYIESLDMALTANLTSIASIGSNAPYVGLLGTVLGIMVTFHDIGQGQSLDAQHIMLGLALALKATAAGLVVAIPSILSYNGLLRRVEVLKSRWQLLKYDEKI